MVNKQPVSLHCLCFVAFLVLGYRCFKCCQLNHHTITLSDLHIRRNMDNEKNTILQGKTMWFIADFNFDTWKTEIHQIKAYFHISKSCSLGAHVIIWVVEVA